MGAVTCAKHMWLMVSEPLFMQPVAFQPAQTLHRWPPETAVHALVASTWMQDACWVHVAGAPLPDAVGPSSSAGAVAVWKGQAGALLSIAGHRPLAAPAVRPAAATSTKRTTGIRLNDKLDIAMVQVLPAVHGLPGAALRPMLRQARGPVLLFACLDVLSNGGHAANADSRKPCRCSLRA